VHVVDNPPVITLLGNSAMDITINSTFTDPGATATDDHDGNISGDIIVGGDNVNTAALGTYRITYDVSDEFGNNAQQVVRTVNVVEAPKTSDGGGGCFISSLLEY
jgi:hypothetical protein